MSKVDELRTIIDAVNAQCENDLHYATGIMEDVDLLIEAAREDGRMTELLGFMKSVLPHCAKCIAA